MDISSPRSPRKDGDCENEETEQLKFNNSNKLLVIYANVDSLSNKLEELKFRISSMHPKPHLIALTEIKHKNKWNIDISELQLDGYIIYCNNLQENGRGIVNYVRSDLVCRQYIPQTPFTESLLLELQLQNKVIVGTIYRSQNSRPDNDNDLLTFINNFSSSVYDSVITNYF